MTPLSQVFTEKAEQALVKIKEEWQKSSGLSSKDFVKKYSQESLPKLDSRTQNFVNCMMDGVRETLLQVPGSIMRFFQIGIENEEKDVAEKCLKLLALPHLLALKDELDQVNRSIVDQIVSSSNKSG